MKRGGAKKGEGTEAFIIDPPIPCKGEAGPRKGYVSRILKNPENTSINPKILEKLREIDPDQKHFYYPVECVPGDPTEENKADGVTEENTATSQLLRYAPGGTWKGGSNEQKDYARDSLALLHAGGIVHRDIIPGNIVIAEDGMPRIIDFQNADMKGSPNFEEFAEEARAEFDEAYTADKAFEDATETDRDDLETALDFTGGRRRKTRRRKARRTTKKNRSKLNKGNVRL